MAAAPAPSTASPRLASATEARAPLSAWYALGVLVVAAVLGAVDQMIMSLLTEPVRIALKLSDTQLGLLQGAGLTLFAGLATLPLGWLSDRFDRRWVLVGCILLWSSATALRGTAQDFSGLFVASLGLGMGAAGLMPIVNSLIPVLFPLAQRALANAVFIFCGLFGSALGSMLGGLFITLADTSRHLLPAPMQGLETWRLTFFGLALLGPLVALLTLSMRRPPRRYAEATELGAVASEAASADTVGYGDYLRSNWRTLVGLVIGTSVVEIGMSAIGTWVPNIAARQFGASPAELGEYVGMAYLGGILFGTALGVGTIRLARRRYGPAAAMRIVMFGNTASALVSILLLFVQSAAQVYVVLGLLVMPLISGAMVAPNLLQDAGPPHLRGRVLAVLMIAALPFGALGPVLIGMLSDSMSSVPNGLAMAVVGITLVSGLIGAIVLRSTEASFVRLARANAACA